MRRLALAIVVLATPAAAQDGPGPGDAEAIVRGFLAAPPGPLIVAARAGNVGIAGRTVQLDALELTLDLPDGDSGSTRWTFTAPVALVDGLARTAGGWRADAIRIPDANLAPAGAAADGTASDGRLGRIELTAPEWPATLEAPATDGPMAAFEPGLRFLAASSAARGSIDGSGFSLAFDGMEEGRIAAATVAVGVPADAGRATTRPEVSVGVRDDAGPATSSAELSGIDIGAIAAALFGDGGASRLALARLSMRDIASDEAAAVDTSIAGFAIEGIRLTPQSPPLAARIDDMAALAKATPPVPPADPLDPDAASPPSPEEIDLGLAVWGAIAVDRVTFDGFRTVDAQTDRAVAIDRFALANLGLGRDLDIVSDGVVVDEERGEVVRIGRIEALGVRVPEPRFIRAMSLAGDTTPSPEVFVGALPIIRRIAVSDLVGETENGVTFAIDTASLEMSDHIGTIPTVMATQISGAFDLDQGLATDDQTSADLVAALKDRGIERIAVAVGDTLRWDDGRLTYAGGTDLRSLLRYEIDLALSGIPRYLFTEPARALEVVAFLAVDGFRVELSDRGLVALVRAVAGEQMPDLDAQLATQLTQMEGDLAAVIGPANASTVREAFARFAAGGQTIVLAAAPPRPVPLTQLGVAAMTPRAIVDLLGLTLTTTPVPQ